MPKPLQFTLACGLALLLTWSPLYSQDSYKAHFRWAGARFLPQLDRSWLRLEAQGIAESNLDPLAISPAGAKGVMQFMPATWQECLDRLNLPPIPPSDAKASIICGGWYMSVQMRRWSGRNRTPLEQWPLGLSDYNGGARYTLRAQADCNDALLWQDIQPCHSFRETRNYVFRVQRIFKGL